MPDDARPELEPLRDHFPIRAGRLELALVADRPVEWHEVRPDEIWATIQSIEFDAEGMVRNIWEQPVRLAPHPNLLADGERVGHCVAAHVELLTEVAADPHAFDHGALPRDLLFVDQLLALRKANTREDFVAALRAHKRLGRRLL
ncbi:hypothetical protein ACNOYE_03425 [Nannocystaceae bacterium ST9]